MNISDDAAWIETVKSRYVHVHNAIVKRMAPLSYPQEEDALIAILIVNKINYYELLK